MSMTPTAHPRNANLLDCSNRQEPAYGPAASDLSGANADPPSRSIHASHPDPFAYYKAFVDTNSSHLRPQSQAQGGDGHRVAQDHDGYTCHDISGAGDVQQDMDYQQQARVRAVPYNLAVRLANRSNGAPLATIAEQGSYSTLNSHGSLLSVGRLPSLRVVENTSPTHAPNKLSHTSEHRNLLRVTEDTHLEHVLDAPSKGYDVPLRKDPKTSPRVDHAAIQPALSTIQPSQSTAYQIVRRDPEANSRDVKSFFRGVVHNVRAASRTLSRSSSTQASLNEHHDDRPETSEDSPYSHLSASDMSQLSDDRLDTPYRMPSASQSLSATRVLAPVDQTRNGQIFMVDPTSSADAMPSLLDAKTYPLESQSTLAAVAQLPPPSVVARSREWSPSVRLVHSEPRDEAPRGRSAEAPTLSNESRNTISAGQTFYGISTSSNISHSLIEHERAREASRNTSFCSTMSTSYSGTVVGVDVDLQHDFSHPVRSSRPPTPIAPVWFTPQMAELERQASISESPPDPNQVPEAVPPRCSITSSALTSLLPIAAASGIVRPNYDTPKISFFSPSGNLIQPEGSSTPGTTSASGLSGLPVANTSYCDNRTTSTTYSAFPTTTWLPPPRPSLRPMTTPPTSSAPLPAHLRFHHNYRRPERSQIDSTTGSTKCFIVPAPSVHGCDGIVLTEGLAPHTKPRHSYEKNKPRPQYKRRKSARSFAEDLRHEARFQRARLITAILASCTSSGKGRVICKRKASSRRAAATASVSIPRNRTGGNVTGARTKRIDSRETTNKRDIGVLGPLAGHTLRICFCQPFDGAGKSTHTAATENTCIGKSDHTRNMQSRSKKESPRTDTKEVEVDAVLPIARVVSGTERKMGNNVRQRTAVRKGKTQSTTGTNQHSRMRSDSAVSVGVALRTATAGG